MSRDADDKNVRQGC